MSEKEKDARAAVTPPAQIAEIDEERALRVRKAVDEQIRSMAPAHLRAVADACVLDGLNVEDSRKRLKEELAKQAAPVGTPEPPDTQTQGAKPEKFEDKIDDKTLLRSLCG